MSAWDDILGVAAVGTERHDVALPRAGGELGRALGMLDASDREGALLGAVALAALHRQAGFRPAADPLPLPEPSEPDEAPRCGAAASQHLALILGGGFKEVLPEWLKALCGARLRVPEEYLPALFERGGAEKGLRPLIAEASGLRGRWLAAQNDGWRWAAAATGPDAWETAGRDERLFMLRALRETDPRKARELLASTWKGESARDRQLFLHALQAGLGGEDEPFLTEALEDRGAEVRRAAADMLLRLPSSSLARLVCERVPPLLGYKKPLLGKARIEVSPPAEPAKWQQENGLRLEVPADAGAAGTHKNLGERGLWLMHAVGWVRPSVWCGLWGRKPFEVLEAARNSEWGEALLRGFVRAAGRYADADWAEAILADQQFRQLLFQDANADGPELVSRMPAARLERILLDELAAGKKVLPLDIDALRLLLRHRTAWGDALSRAVAAGVKARIREGAASVMPHWQLGPALKQFALYVSPALADELSADWPADTEGVWQKPLEEFHSVLGFRRDMLRAVRQEEGKES